MRSANRWLPASMAPLLLATACAVGPDYHAPAPPEAQAFVNAPLLAERASPPPAPAADRWWTGFGDAELVRVVDLALAQNLDLAAAGARADQAAAAARAARASLLPAGQANAQAAYSHQSLQSPLGAIEAQFPGFPRDQELYDLGAAASWDIDLFGGLRRASQAARASYQASEAARAGARLTVAGETADAYVQVRAFQARLAVAQDQAEAQRRLVKLVRLEAQRGVAARLQLDQAEGALAAVEASIPVLQAGLEAELDRLEVLVGVLPGTLHQELAAAAPVPRAPGLDASGGPAALVRRRPDVIAAERTLAAADARIGAAISDYYPKISLSAVVGSETGDVTKMFTSAAYQPQALAGLRWRLFDFGRVDAEVAAARGARAEALAAYRKSVLQATADVETSLTALVRRESQAQTLLAGETSLVRARDAAQAAYQAGRLSLIEVLDADDRLLSARDQRVQADAEAARAAIASFQALGGGWTA